ncbi:hypothetical protein Mapa_005337 [Marchantia paleacea]|nr:hypothetical protein Mapa_005337 [Marchantia paleacea]
MGASCSSSCVDEARRGRRQLQWPAAALSLRDLGRNQGHRIKSSSYPSQWLGHAVASTKGASLAFFSFSSSSSYPSSPPSPNSSDTEVAVQELREAQLGDHEHGEGPKLSMFDQDFVVTSSLREHLLLMIALSRKVTNPENSLGEAASGSTRPTRRPKVFKGNFKAISTFVAFNLGRDAQRVLHEPNAGGSSSISESLSVEYFARRFQARDIVTEMEVEYCMKNWKKVDYICTLYGERVGVSVTRAMSYPNPEQFSKDTAYKLLYKKLFGLVVARHGVKEKHNFSRCILHIWCETHSAAKLLEILYPRKNQHSTLSAPFLMYSRH